MSPESKIWIYFSEKAFDQSTASDIAIACQNFCSTWTAHDMLLTANYRLLYNHFIILIVDETKTKASGCSIDKSVAFIQTLEKAHGLDFFNRLAIPFLIKQQVVTHPFNALQTLYDNEEIQADTQTFNLQVSTLKAFEEDFIQTFDQHWLSNKLKTTINQ